MMTSSLKLWIPLTLVAGWVLGHGTARALRPLPQPSEPSPQELALLRARIEALPVQLSALQSQTRCSGKENTAGLDPETLRAELRQILREELSASMAQPEPTKTAEPVPPSVQLSPANLAALERGQRLLEDALRARRWGDAQVEELHRLLPEMTSSQQLMLTQRLAASINRGELTVDATDFPF